MQESNESPEPSRERDFSQDLQQAQASGDYSFMLDTAKQSHKMLIDFRDVVGKASFLGRDTQAVAMGLNFLDRMIQQSSGQIEGMKQAEKQAKASLKAQENGAVGATDGV